MRGTRLVDREAESGIGEQIRAAREAAGVTRKVMADALHISPQQVRKYEAGEDRLSLSRAIAMARVLNMSLDELVPLHSKEGAQAKGGALALSSLPSADREIVATLIRRLCDRQTEQIAA